VKSSFLVVAKNGDLVNKFEQDSMVQAVNLRDFLEGLHDYQDVSIFQLSPNSKSSKEWVKMDVFES
jgi:hypothetical protein